MVPYAKMPIFNAPNASKMLLGTHDTRVRTSYARKPMVPYGKIADFIRVYTRGTRLVCSHLNVCERNIVELLRDAGSLRVWLCVLPSNFPVDFYRVKWAWPT